jgi:hypothetical protein
LLIAFGHYATVLEDAFFDKVSIQTHYILIILGQLLISLIGLVFLYKLLDKKYHLRTAPTIILLLIYAFSTAQIIYTFVAESYIFSGTILILTYWCMLNKKTKSLVVLGILAGGVTITNFAIWAIIVLFLSDTFRLRCQIIISSGIGLLAVILVLPIRSVFYNNLFKVFISSPQNYADHYSILRAGKMGFYSIFGSSYFFIDTVNQSPFGLYPGMAISFIPSASMITNAAMCLLIVGIIFASIIGIRNRDKRLLVPLAVLLFNIALHVGIQYGLKESFLYSLHHLFAQVLIIAYLYTSVSKKWIKATVYAFGIVFLLVMLGTNFIGGIHLVDYLNTLCVK